MEVLCAVNISLSSSLPVSIETRAIASRGAFRAYVKYLACPTLSYRKRDFASARRGTAGISQQTRRALFRKEKR